MICPHCKKDIPDTKVAKHMAQKGGAAKSAAKTRAARENIKKRWAKANTKKGTE